METIIKQKRAQIIKLSKMLKRNPKKKALIEFGKTPPQQMQTYEKNKPRIINKQKYTINLI